MAGFHADVVTKVEAAVKSDAVVVVGMAQNPVVKKAQRDPVLVRLTAFWS